MNEEFLRIADEKQRWKSGEKSFEHQSGAITREVFRGKSRIPNCRGSRESLLQLCVAALKAYDSVGVMSLSHGGLTLNTLSTAMRMCWSAVRLPVLGVLVLLEPAVRIVCSLALVLGVSTSIVFEISAVGPSFPFLGMVALSLGFGLFLCAYYGLLALLSR